MNNEKLIFGEHSLKKLQLEQFIDNEFKRISDHILIIEVYSGVISYALPNGEVKYASVWGKDYRIAYYPDN